MEARIAFSYKHAMSTSVDLIAAALRDILLGLSWRVEFVDFDYMDADPAVERKGIVWFFFTNMKYFKAKRKVPCGTKILMNTQRLDCMLEDGTFDCDTLGRPVRLRRIIPCDQVRLFWRKNQSVAQHRILRRKFVDIVFDYNPHNGLWWKDRVKWLFVPIGFHERFILGEQANDRSAISFFGRMKSMRRRAIRERIVEEGCRVVHTRSPFQRRIIRRYGISLHVASRDGHNGYPTLRMCFLAANNCLVVSERCDWTPLEDDDWVECLYEDLPKRCRRSMDGDYDEFAGKMAKFYREDFCFRDHIRRALKIAL